VVVAGVPMARAAEPSSLARRITEARQAQRGLETTMIGADAVARGLRRELARTRGAVPPLTRRIDAVVRARAEARGGIADIEARIAPVRAQIEREARK